MKWWGKSPPRRGQPKRHGKPRVVQDRTGEGLPVRLSPGNSRTPRKRGAPPRRGERNDRPVPLRQDGQNPAYRGAVPFFLTERRASIRELSTSRPPEEEAASGVDRAERDQSGLQGSGPFFPDRTQGERSRAFYKPASGGGGRIPRGSNGARSIRLTGERSLFPLHCRPASASNFLARESDPRLETCV